MKKIYTLALMAAVTFGASAERAAYNGEKVTPVKGTIVNDAKAIVADKQKSRKAIARSEASDELQALNTWSCYGLLNGASGYLDYPLSVEVVDEETGEVNIVLMNDSKFTITGTYNAEEYTLTIPNNQYMFSDSDGPIYFYAKELDADGYLVDGAAEAEEIVGIYMDGVAEFPEEFAWAAGDPEQEGLGWYFLTSENYFVAAEVEPDPFEDAYLCPDGQFNDNILYPLFMGEENTETVDVEVYSNGEGMYKVIHPFQTLYTAIGAGPEVQSPAMVIDATDPDNVVLDLQSTGINGGSDGVYGYASFDWADVPEDDQLITMTVDGNNVTITFPYHSTIVYASGSGKIYYGSAYESTLTFTDENIETGVKNVEAAAEGPAVYYNLQGVRVENPEGVVIRVQDGKATKMLVK